jgi:hypothetical protein
MRDTQMTPGGRSSSVAECFPPNLQAGRVPNLFVSVKEALHLEKEKPN